MNLTIRFLGLELLHIEANTEAAEECDVGDCTTTPVGFGGYHGDQRYEASPGIDLE